MQHYKAPNGELYCLDNGEDPAVWLPAGCVKITDKQADALRAAAISPDDLVKAQIAAIESTVTPRRLREALLGIDGGWLKSADDQIAALRATLGAA